jgi:hypothetical protein
VDKETLKMLGLKSDATEDEIAEAVLALSAKAHDTEAKLEKESEARKAAADTVAMLRAEHQAKIKAELSDEVKRIDTDARARGLWEPGSTRQKHFERLVATDMSLTREFIATLQPSNPVGQGMQSAGQGSAKPTDETEQILRSEYRLSDDVSLAVVKDQFRQLGITPEIFKASNPRAVEAAQNQAGYDWTAPMRKGDK